jgi:ribosomal-protein-alanine N-acetyltransferase
MAGDCETLARLHAASFADAWTRRAIADLLAAPWTFGFVTPADAEIQGFVLARAAAGEAEILTIAVHPDARRQGFARRLMEATAAEAARRGAGTLLLEVAVDRAPALGLYGALGFAGAGQRKAYYARAGGPAADALILKRDLPTLP